VEETTALKRTRAQGANTGASEEELAAQTIPFYAARKLAMKMFKNEPGRVNNCFGIGNSGTRLNVSSGKWKLFFSKEESGCIFFPIDVART
jgi:hypothetical protein